MVNLIKTLYSLQPASGRKAWTYPAALIVAALTLFGGGSRMLETYEGLTATDQMVRMSARLSGAEDRAIPVTLVEIDDETRTRWGNPVITPHAAIAGLIGKAREAGARLILLDLDLSSDTPAQAPDPKLYDELAHYPAAGPPLQIVRAIRFRAAEGAAAGPGFIADSYRRTPYDPAIAGNPAIAWVSALPALGEDRVVRKIRLWQTLCDGAAGIAYPSAPLAAAASLSRRPDDLRGFLDARIARECGAKPDAKSVWPPQQSHEVALPLVIGATQKSPALRTKDNDGRPTDLFRRIGAWTLMRVDGEHIESAGQVDPNVFRDRAVLIGATHADSRDTYATPLGTMPGVVILANAVAMANVIVDTPDASSFTKSGLALMLFLAFAFIGTRFQAAAATVLIGAIALIALMIMARWLGFAAAVQAIAIGLTVFALYKIADSIVTIIYDWRAGLGWRALLKSRPGGKH